MIQEIEKFYNDFFNDCDNTNCCNQKELIEKYDKNRNHIYNHGLIITKGYCNSSRRILIIGQERKENRLNKVEEINNVFPLKGNSTKHWRRTMICIIKFCKPEYRFEEIKSESSTSINNYLSNVNFAFTNFYKCAFAKNGLYSRDLIHTETMKKNCIKCLIKEIELLGPTVILLQCRSLSECIICQFDNCQLVDEFDRIKLYSVQLNNRSYKIICMDHPSTKYWWKNRKKYFELIETYINAGM